MKVAFVTTRPAIRSRVGDYTRELLDHLPERIEVDVYAEGGGEGEEIAGRPVLAARTLKARDVEQIVYQVGNERAHAFMVPMLRSFGGVVALHDWVLFELAAGAYPALERGGLRGHWEAWRSGGLEQARRYARSRAAGEHHAIPFNRSVVRQGDAFVVHSSSLEQQILQDRNAPTPVGVLPPADELSWAELGERYAELLEAFPAHRANRKSLIRTAIDHADRARAEKG